MCISETHSNIVQVISFSRHRSVRLSTSSPASKKMCVCVCVCWRCVTVNVVAIMEYWVRLAPFQSVLQLLFEKNNLRFCRFPPSSTTIQMERLISLPLSDYCGETFKGNTFDLSITVQLYTLPEKNNDTVTWMSAYWSISDFFFFHKLLK